MTNPLVTIIVVNYNSKAIEPIARKSIEAILSINYCPLEIIFIDNGSTDGSDDMIRGIIENHINSKNQCIKVKFIKLNKNFGFAGASYIAFKYRSPKSKYIALINNDLIPEKESLKKFIDYLEKHPRVAGVQGLLLRFDSKIDAAGPYITNYWLIIDRRDLIGNPKELLKEAYISYIDGAYAVFKVDKIIKSGRLFIPLYFSYGEDLELGLRLWCNGFVLKFLPIFAGWHWRGGSWKLGNKKNKLYIYLNVRNILATMIVYDLFWPFKIIAIFPIIIYNALNDRILLRAFYDSIFMGRKIRKFLKKFIQKRSLCCYLKMSLIEHYVHYTYRKRRKQGELFIPKLKIELKC